MSYRPYPVRVCRPSYSCLLNTENNNDNCRSAVASRHQLKDVISLLNVKPPSYALSWLMVERPNRMQTPLLDTCHTAVHLLKFANTDINSIVCRC